MRSLSRSVLLCVFIVVVTPGPAHAWFEWLDRFSGPGYWWGGKVDVRALCFGPKIAAGSTAPTFEEFSRNVAQLRRIDESLRVLKSDELGQIESELRQLSALRFEGSARNRLVSSLQAAQDEVGRSARFAAAPGILYSLCSPDRVRTFALEFGVTGLVAPGDEKFADGEKIWMSTFTVGLSYRIPLSVDSDVIDLGTNLGTYRFYSDKLRPFSGLVIEPFVDLHLPTRWQMEGSKMEQFFGRFTVRGGLTFFPGGFAADKFGPGTPEISGKEANPSITVFFRVNNPAKRAAP